MPFLYFYHSFIEMVSYSQMQLLVFLERLCKSCIVMPANTYVESIDLWKLGFHKVVPVFLWSRLGLYSQLGKLFRQNSLAQW